MTNTQVELDFASTRPLQGEKFVSTTAQHGSVAQRDGLGLLTVGDGTGVCTTPVTPLLVQTIGYVRDRSPMAHAQGGAARGAPV